MTNISSEAKKRDTSGSSVRESLLQNAIDLTIGDRNAEYGEPVANMQVTADYITIYLKSRNLLKEDWCLSARDAAVILSLVKLARMARPNVSGDTFCDGAAYIAIAGECELTRGGF